MSNNTNKQQQAQGFRNSSQADLSGQSSADRKLLTTQQRQDQQQQDNNSAQEISAQTVHRANPANQSLQPVSNPNIFPNSTSTTSRKRHVYLEEEYVYGRFTPYLLLKDKLHTHIDQNGHTVLNQMLSRNSEYLPLYLSTLKYGDPILNEKSRIGHVPLDVAAVHARREYVDMLLDKGAKDQGNIDHWAIQGGNIYNWTGNVDITKKPLIHWAAYNDMPDVLWEFYRQGAVMNEKDENEFTPIDLAVINKSYKSIKALIDMGQTTKEDHLKNCGSKSIERMFQRQKRTSQQKKNEKIAKAAFLPVFSLIALMAMLITAQDGGVSFHFRYFLNLAVIWLWAWLTFFKKVQPQPIFANSRRSSFHSDLIMSQVNNQSNHLAYTGLSICTFLEGLTSVIYIDTPSYFMAVVYWVCVYITLVFLVNSTLMLIGIAKNLTHQEMYDRETCKYLFKQIIYIQEKKILFKKFRNMIDRGWKQNFKRYWKRQTGRNVAEGRRLDNQ